MSRPTTYGIVSKAKLTAIADQIRRILGASGTYSLTQIASELSSITRKTSATITPTTTNQTIASRTYLAGIQTILGDADLVPANIKTGVSIFGVTGNLDGEKVYAGTLTMPSPVRAVTITLPNTPTTIKRFMLISKTSGGNMWDAICYDGTTTRGIGYKTTGAAEPPSLVTLSNAFSLSGNNLTIDTSGSSYPFFIADSYDVLVWYE